MRIAAAIFSVLLLAACSSATKPEYEKIPEGVPEQGAVSIAYLKSLCGSRSTVIDKDISIVGSVVANDLHGEFQRTVVIADASGGVEISVDKRNLYLDFPIFTQVAVSCNGLALGRTGGKVSLGAPPTGGYATDRIVAADIARFFSPVAGYADTSEPAVVSIGELSVEHVSSFVFIGNLRAVEEERGAAWCDAAGDDYADSVRHFTDTDGNMLAVRIYGSCSYAHERIPEGRVSLAGIVDYASGDFFLRISNHHIMPL